MPTCQSSQVRRILNSTTTSFSQIWRQNSQILTSGKTRLLCEATGAVVLDKLISKVTIQAVSGPKASMQLQATLTLV